MQYPCTSGNGEEKYHQMLQVLHAWNLPCYYSKCSRVKSNVKGAGVALFALGNRPAIRLLLPLDILVLS